MTKNSRQAVADMLHEEPVCVTSSVYIDDMNVETDCETDARQHLDESLVTFLEEDVGRLTAPQRPNSVDEIQIRPPSRKKNDDV